MCQNPVARERRPQTTKTRNQIPVPHPTCAAGKAPSFDAASSRIVEQGQSYLECIFLEWRRSYCDQLALLGVKCNAINFATNLAKDCTRLIGRKSFTSIAPTFFCSTVGPFMIIEELILAHEHCLDWGQYIWFDDRPTALVKFPRAIVRPRIFVGWHRFHGGLELLFWELRVQGRKVHCWQPKWWGIVVWIKQ